MSLSRLLTSLLSVAVLLCAAVASAAPPLAYVTDLSSTVTVIDTLTRQITGRFTPPLSAGFVGVAVSPDGSTVYLADGNHSIVIVTSRRARIRASSASCSTSR